MNRRQLTELVEQCDLTWREVADMLFTYLSELEIRAYLAANDVYVKNLTDVFVVLGDKEFSSIMISSMDQTEIDYMFDQRGLYDLADMVLT